MNDINLFIVVYYNDDQSGRESRMTVTKNQKFVSSLCMVYGLKLSHLMFLIMLIYLDSFGVITPFIIESIFNNIIKQDPDYTKYVSIYEYIFSKRASCPKVSVSGIEMLSLSNINIVFYITMLCNIQAF